jgi:short-subunit dehydrogenase
MELDLSDLDKLPDALRDVSKQHPDINAVVLNAGVGRFGSLEQFSPHQIRQLIDLNLTSHVLLAREFLPKLKKQGISDLVFIGSESALRGGRYGSIYAATKFGLRGLVQALQEECSASGIRVGIVNPGMVNTSFFDELDFRPGDEADQHLLPDDVVAAVLLMLEARPGAVIQEINLQPQKNVIRFD